MITPYKVLVAEDSGRDPLLMATCLGRFPSLQLIGELHHDDQVRAYLRGKGIYSDRQAYPLPDLLLHDAVTDGESVTSFLDWLKRHPVTNLVVVIFTSSLSPDGCIDFVKNGAHACYTKPEDEMVLESYLHEIEINMVNGHYRDTQASRIAALSMSS
jgi:hypothetical protein